MARKARVLSPINSYTILLKAYDDVSFSNHDLTMFLDTVSKYSNTLNYKFLAYDLNEKVLAPKMRPRASSLRPRSKQPERITPAVPTRRPSKA